MEQILKAKLIIKKGLLCLFSFMAPIFVYAQANDQESIIQQKLKSLIYDYSIPGAVLTYGFDNQPLHTIAVGYRDVSKREPMASSSYFDGGSTAKSMTAVLILQLAEQGKFQLDDNLRKIASQYGGGISTLIKEYPALAKMTLRQLLNHTSGVPEAINTDEYKRRFKENPHYYWSAEALIKLAMQRPVYFKPGEPGAWSYTNTDYILLALVIEAVTGRTIAENYQALWKKANLSRPYYADKGFVPKEVLPQLATGYVMVNQEQGDSPFKKWPVVTIPGKNPISAHSLLNAYNSNAPGAGGVFINAINLAQWYRALFHGNILTANSIEKMLTSIPNGAFNAAGCGLGVTLHEMQDYGYVISHDGLTPGYSVIVMYFKKYRLFLALMTNSSNAYVSTFNVHNGKIIPGLVTQLLPYLVPDEKANPEVALMVNKELE